MLREVIAPRVLLADLVVNSSQRPIMPVVLHGYCDGTGSPTKNLIGLAGCVASPDAWTAFETDWWRILSDDSERPACRSLHMTDANALQDEFAPDKGWAKQGVDLLLRDLLNCISRHGSVRGSACSVDLGAYERVCREQPHFADKRSEGLCVDHVVGSAIGDLVPSDEDGMYGHELVARRGSLALFFDRGEPFRHQIQRVWEAKPWHKRSWPLKLVSSITLSDREASAGIQVADFVAWHMNRDVASESGDLKARLLAYFASGFGDVRIFDYDELSETASRWSKDGGYRRS